MEIKALLCRVYTYDIPQTLSFAKEQKGDLKMIERDGNSTLCALLNISDNNEELKVVRLSDDQSLLIV